MFPGANAFMQAAYLVRDFDTALDHWLKQGAGPFYVGRRMTLDLAYRDRPAKLELSVAWGQFDGIQVELIEQHCTNPSAFRDLFPEGVADGPGSLHHMGMLNHDYDKAMAGATALGYRPATSGCFDGTRFAHMDARPAYGFMIELTEATPNILAFYDTVEKAARGWTGADPVRPL